MPMNQRIEDSLDTDGLVMASTDAAIPEKQSGIPDVAENGVEGSRPWQQRRWQAAAQMTSCTSVQPPFKVVVK